MTSIETAQADGMDNRGNGVQFPAQAIDFSLLDMVMTGIRLFKNFNDNPPAMAYIWGSDAEMVMRSGIASAIGLGVACWPLVPKFAGSNPAEAVGFLRRKKLSSRLPSEGK